MLVDGNIGEEMQLPLTAIPFVKVNISVCF